MLTSDAVRDELARAFATNHGHGCTCCRPFPNGRSPLELALEAEARVAIGRYDRQGGLVDVDDAPDDAELEQLVCVAAGDALAAAREAITARAIRGLIRGQAAGERPAAVIRAIDPATHRITCRAETFDGVYRRQCTRPARFTRDGLEVCNQHARLTSTRAAVI